MNIEVTEVISRRLSELHRLCPEMRFAQMVATVGLLGEDATDRSLWDMEDDEFLAAIDRFRQDLLRREQVSI